MFAVLRNILGPSYFGLSDIDSNSYIGWDQSRSWPQLEILLSEFQMRGPSLHVRIHSCQENDCKGSASIANFERCSYARSGLNGESEYGEKMSLQVLVKVV